MNARQLSRREFMKAAAVSVATAATNHLSLAAAPDTPQPVSAPEHSLTVISGKPRERGRQYGAKFRDDIREFLERQIYKPFVTADNSRDVLLRYADECSREIGKFSPTIAEELVGMAEGAGIRLEEMVLLTAHEELYHRGKLPVISHCTAMTAGPPSTRDGCTYVGQSWDWMKTVYGLSRMLLWKRPEGPSVLAYSYPGLWVSAGLNSAGVALCWTSAALNQPGPRVGIPSYVLIAQMLYQPTLEAAVAEARRARQAGWFSFVLADDRGQLASVEGTRDELAVEFGRGHLARVYYGTRQITHTAPEHPVPRHPQCQRMWELLDGSKGQLDLPTLQGFYGDHKSTICKHLAPERGGGSLDVMIFNTTKREAHITRGPACQPHWKTFRFDA